MFRNHVSETKVHTKLLHTPLINVYDIMILYFVILLTISSILSYNLLCLTTG